MNCPQCGQPIGTGAVFCGNCGQAMQPAGLALTAPAPPAMAPAFTAMAISVGGQEFLPAQPAGTPIAQVLNNQMPAVAPPYSVLPMTPALAATVGLPSYAIAPTHHPDTKLVLALVFGIVGIVGAILVAAAGLLFGITGIVLATTAPRSAHTKLKLAGIIFSSLALVAALAVMASAISYKSKHPTGATVSSTATSPGGVVGTNTPCYSFSFISQFNVENTSKTCSLSAYNANSLATSSDIYKVLSSAAPTLNNSNFARISKDALEQDIHQSLPGFSITSEHASQFAGSPAYTINASDGATNVAVQETTVLHATAQGDNLFVLVHATSGSKTDLGELEANWLWK